MQDLQTQYEEAAVEFEMAFEDGAAMYWWCEMHRLEGIMAQEEESRHLIPDVAPDVMMEMMAD